MTLTSEAHAPSGEVTPGLKSKPSNLDFERQPPLPNPSSTQEPCSSTEMTVTSKTYRDEFILPDNRSVGAINIPPEKQGKLDFISVHCDPAHYYCTPDSTCVYLCGNSLGASPKQSQALVQEELSVWGRRCVRPLTQLIIFSEPTMTQFIALLKATFIIHMEDLGQKCWTKSIP